MPDRARPASPALTLRTLAGAGGGLKNFDRLNVPARGPFTFAKVHYFRGARWSRAERPT
jgi:hypothetical protein